MPETGMSWGTQSICGRTRTSGAFEEL
ncbi:hypothetical protein [Thiobacillus denitrificans]